MGNSRGGYQKVCSDCETYGLLDYFKWGMVQEVTIKCVRIVRYTD